MIRAIKILIIDPDQFFVDGLQWVIRAHFKAKGFQVVFLPGPLFHPLADLIFWTPGDPTSEMPVWLFARRTQTAPVILLLSQDTPHMAANFMPSVFYRHQRGSHLSSLINQVMNTTPNHLAEPANKKNCPQLALLSIRQQEVMKCVAKGLRVSEISARLHIHEKTVSSHKRAAMRKLQLSRVTDLYQWLLVNDLMEDPVEK